MTKLVLQAQRLTGTKEKIALVRQALVALIERESALRLAQLAGSEPGATAVPRRQPTPYVILIDTSVWIEHLRGGEPDLSSLLQDGQVSPTLGSPGSSHSAASRGAARSSGYSAISRRRGPPQTARYSP